MTKHTQRYRLMLASLILLGLIGLLILGLRDPAQLKAQFYDPGRDALVEAQWELSHAIPHGNEAKAEKPNKGHLQQVSELLAEARQAHPDRPQELMKVEQLLAQLKAQDQLVKQHEARRAELYQTIHAELHKLSQPSSQL